MSYRSPLRVALTAALAAAVLAAGHLHAAPKKTLTAFANEQEITDLFRRWAEEARRRDHARRSTPSPQESAGMGALQSAAPAAAKAAEDSVTNVQHAGVDEGGIVKRHGDHLVILRRGRLFTVRIGGEALEPVSVADAYGAGIDPRGAWYDEMLISGNTIAVIGYSYARGGTEIGLFDISRDGRLAYRSTHHLRSNDYYSSRNYASRLIGSKLVFYTPLALNPWGGDPWGSFPALRRWRPGATAAEFKPIAPATRIYRTDEPLDPHLGVALHTVTVCDLTRAELDCESTAVLGTPGRVFYVSAGSVYVWTTPWHRHRGEPAAQSAVFRIPLDGSAPTALKTAGSPIDQFSFLESEDHHLNVLVRAHGRGDGMWAAERGAGELALLRVPLDHFTDGREAAPENAYLPLPRPRGRAIQNRFVGSWLLYGAGAGWNRPGHALDAQLYAVRYASGTPAETLPLVHGVDRIEALGRNAVAIGSDGRDLHFTSVRLGWNAAARDRYTRPGAAQGETRSHGFYYKAENGREGTIGLPIVAGNRAASRQLRENSAAVLFLSNRSLRLTELGALESQPHAGANDGCRASCVDWYGNARPLFVGNRVFALMGYEIVEGELANGRIAEARRVSFSPVTVSLAR